jgi:hypothetical protein
MSCVEIKDGAAQTGKTLRQSFLMLMEVQLLACAALKIFSAPAM